MVRKREKSGQTHSAILRVAVEIAAVQGIHNISLGDIAKRLGLSKSGVFLRSGSLGALQLQVIDEYERVFLQTVLLPTLGEPKGLPRLNAMVRLWIQHGSEMKTLTASHYAAANRSSEDEEDPLRDRLYGGLIEWRKTLEASARDARDLGHLRPDTDPEQLVFEIVGLVTAFLNDNFLLRDGKAAGRAMTGYARLLSTYLNFPSVMVADPQLAAAQAVQAASAQRPGSGDSGTP